MGASSGLGLALAKALAKGGIRLGLAARRTEELKALADLYPGQIEFESIDITSRQTSSRLEELIDRLGGLDIYIHAAGIGYSNPDLDIDLEVRTVSTNAVGFAACLSTVFRHFEKSGEPGQIVAFTSVAGTKGIGRMAAYSASKAFDSTYITALDQLAHAEGLDIAFTDIRPGWVRTPLLSPDKSYPMEMTLDYVLPQILNAIVEKKRVAVIDWKWNLLVGMWRMLPNALWARMNFRVSD